MAPPDSGAQVANPVAERRQQSNDLFPVKLAFSDYDRTRPLADGRVKAKGIALTATVQWVADFCSGAVYEAFDAAELSMSLYLPAFDRRENCIAIPVFPLRDPVWGCAYVRSDSSLTHPRDLAGKRIGLSTFRGTFALWMRGLFKEHYDFSPEQATWCTGGPEPDNYVVPKGVKVEISAGKTPLDKLKDGEVDCIWLPRVPKPFFEGEPWIRRLFPDAQGEMQRFVKRTGISAIGHTIVMNKGLVQREPWVAESLFHAFVEAQKLADEVCQIEKVTSYIDSTFIVEQQRWAYGPNPYGHGLQGNNRKIVETFVRYAHEQNYISRPYAIEELFAENTLGL